MKHCISKTKKILSALLLSSMLFGGMLPATAHAQIPQPWKGPSEGGVCVYEAQFDSGTANVATLQGLQCLIANVLGLAVTFIGLIAFGIFIISGFQIMLSGGNSKGLDAAKGSMTYAVVGLVVALSAFIILNLISSFTGINFTNFVIPGPSTQF